jgi:hypothetical protein
MRDRPKGAMNQKKRKVKHADVKEDKSLVKKMVKKTCLV